MIGLVLTLDYEIYGNGEGSVQKLVIEPTRDFIEICEKFNAKATIFVEVAELVKMREYSDFETDVSEIETQLKHLHQNGHDIQLHIHPWWFNAQYQDGKWKMDYELSSLCHLNTEKIFYYVNKCKHYLVNLFKNSDRTYKCGAYRAGYWSMVPTQNMHDALLKADINIDSSVYKWGVLQTELMSFDYRNAHSNLKPWFVKREDVNLVDPNPSNPSRLLEVPIYAEHQRGFRFLNRKRIYLMRKVKSAMLENSADKGNIYFGSKLAEKLRQLIYRQAKKLDFCKCTIREMKQMTANIINRDLSDGYLPVVAIGHSKDFIYKNDLKTYLSYIKETYSGIVEMATLTEAADNYLRIRQHKDD